MSRNVFLLAALPLLAGVGFAASRAAAPMPKTGRVTVTAQCVNGEVRHSINPWRLEIDQGDEVEWNIPEGAQVDSIAIDPKESGRWPFSANQRKGHRGQPARSGDMRPNQAGQTYQYNVEVWCTDNRGDALHEVIDPDIIIREEATRQ